MVIWGVGQGGFGPNLHSYVSSMLPYSKRSRYLGMVEYSWALAGIVGLFLFGRVIELYGWKAPLFILSAGLILSSLVMSTLPRSRRSDEAAATPSHAAVRRNMRTSHLSSVIAGDADTGKTGNLADGVRRFFYL